MMEKEFAQRRSPCEGCVRNCTNYKRCSQFRKWFSGRWNEIRREYHRA